MRNTRTYGSYYHYGSGPLRQKPTAGYEARIRLALNRGPRPMSVRGLQKELEKRFPDLRGTSYGGVRLYTEDNNVRNPRVELLRAFAEVLEVRADWLAFDEGEMTEAEQAAADLVAPESWVMKADPRTGFDQGMIEALADELPRVKGGLVRTIHRIVGLLEEMPATVLLDTAPEAIETLLGGGVRERHAMERHLKEGGLRAVARAIRAPADVLGIDLDEIPEDDFALYVDSMAVTLSVLATGRRRADRNADPDKEESNG